MEATFPVAFSTFAAGFAFAAFLVFLAFFAFLYLTFLVFLAFLRGTFLTTFFFALASAAELKMFAGMIPAEKTKIIIIAKKRK